MGNCTSGHDISENEYQPTTNDRRRLVRRNDMRSDSNDHYNYLVSTGQTGTVNRRENQNQRRQNENRSVVLGVVVASQVQYQDKIQHQDKVRALTQKIIK
ncbi:unnamed protein product [Bursaphelenchus okinawaensis]|uniref:Uncharacterized protein n=1 Tax=Bursaphelenchus okinawaensis TaxID=465554 RepID=A0A811LRV2_9BILA|nr:unnamed protein product [Bursaphelenchus okinawaensis]CAG9127844.1 unnamed protein product [Bursaphelenchus okinawaensis]